MPIVPETPKQKTARFDGQRRALEAQAHPEKDLVYEYGAALPREAFDRPAPHRSRDFARHDSANPRD